MSEGWLVLIAVILIILAFALLPFAAAVVSMWAEYIFDMIDVWEARRSRK